MTSALELVVLVDENGVPHWLGREVRGAHDRHPLHVAFSRHVYNEDGRVLVTWRALGKLTWPGVWTNSFCGHPAPGEAIEDALARRGALELAIAITAMAR